MNVKNMPKKAARVVVQEAFETLKKAKEQVTATGEYIPNVLDEKKEGENKAASEEQKAKTEGIRKRHLMAYQKEAQDMIVNQQKEEMKRKQEEEIQRQQQEAIPKEPPPQISSVPSRGRGKLSSLKKKISDLGKFVEVRKPPSG